GQDVAVLDAMKMETRVAAHRSGTLRRAVDEGGAVAVDDAIGRVER
ncbi:biotin/lipoyl-containing protein, partial [Agrococcus sp. HG114]